jgi:hypothetical protein
MVVLPVVVAPDGVSVTARSAFVVERFCTKLERRLIKPPVP